MSTNTAATVQRPRAPRDRGVLLNAPTPAEVRAARERSGVNQETAAALVGLGSKNRWSEFETGVAPMDAVRWEFFLLHTGQHPTHRLVRRRAPD